MIRLTPRMRDLLAFLTREPDASIVEMATGIGAANGSTSARLLDGLEQRGYIRRLRNRVRAIEVIRPLPIHINGHRYRFIPAPSERKGG